MKRHILSGLALSILLFAAPWVQATAGWDPDEPKPSSKSGDAGNRAVNDAIAKMKRKDAGLNRFFNKAYGYAIYPTVIKAGIGIGGASGEGEVYRRGRFIGTSSLSQLSIGFQLGGQAFTEIIFFKDKSALDTFIEGNFELGAQASAIALTEGISADADYDNGVAIFTMPKKGLMYEAVIAGQKFSFEPK